MIKEYFGSDVLLSSENFFVFGTVAFLFLFDKYCLIIK